MLIYHIHNFSSLRKACEVELCKRLNAKNCAKICLAAFDFNAIGLKDVALKKVKENLGEIALKKEYLIFMNKYTDHLVIEDDEEEEDLLLFY